MLIFSGALHIHTFILFIEFYYNCIFRTLGNRYCFLQRNRIDSGIACLTGNFGCKNTTCRFLCTSNIGVNLNCIWNICILHHGDGHSSQLLICRSFYPKYIGLFRIGLYLICIDGSIILIIVIVIIPRFKIKNPSCILQTGILIRHPEIAVITVV